MAGEETGLGVLQLVPPILAEPFQTPTSVAVPSLSQADTKHNPRRHRHHAIHSQFISNCGVVNQLRIITDTKSQAVGSQ